MTLQQITKDDIAGWDSLDDVSKSLKKRGLKPEPSLGEDHELVLRLTDDDEFMVLIHAPPGETAASFKSRTNVNTHTGLVATDDFEEFTFITRIRTWDAHGRTKYQQLSFSKEQMTSARGEKNTILQKLNTIEFNKPETIFDSLYDTKQVVKAFYEDFEELRTELVQEVAGIDDDRGDAKQRYVQVTLDRMIFLYFIQEKGLLDYERDYLHQKHEEFAAKGDVYQDFYEPLFFEILAEGKKDGDFGVLPYLNGGLFSKNPIEEEFEDARLGDSPEQTAELFEKVLEFLSDWNWNVDERLDIVDPKNLSPAILGHIFEQTVNQKEMGAYYTPEEITGFMSRRTVHPWLIDRVNEEYGTDYDAIDDIFSLDVATVSQSDSPVATDGGVAQTVDLDTVNQDHVQTLYFDALKELRVLDPAVGSGAFLLAAQEVLLDVYLQCLEYFQELRDDRPWELPGRIEDELDTIDATDGTMTLYAKKQIILNNLYGVDIDDGAVEICKLRLWLSMVADIENNPKEVEPLPNIDFNIRQGNSLIGFTDVQEVARKKQGDASLSNFGGGVGASVKEMYDDIIDAVEKHREATTGSTAVNARKIAESRIAAHTDALDEKILEEFKKAGAEHITKEDLEGFSPFHWVLEFASVYADGGFNIVIGNPPWDTVKHSRDDYFPKFDEVFRSREQSEKDKIQEELLKDEEIKAGWEQHKEEMKTRALYYNNSSNYHLQNPTVDGRGVASENELSALFLERVLQLASSESYVSQILPGILFSGSIGKDLRVELLNETTVNSLVHFENKGIFGDLHDQYKFGVLTFKNNGRTEELNGIFDQRDTDVLRNLDEVAVRVPKRVLLEFSPEARIFPTVTSQTQVNVLNTIFSHPSLKEDVDGAWTANPLREELHSARDSDRFLETSENGDYPVYGGSNIYQFYHDNSHLDLDGPKYWSVSEESDPKKSAKSRIRTKRFNSGDLKKAIYTKFGGESTSQSQIGFVNSLLTEHRSEELSEADIRLDCSEYRIGYRDITNKTNERTLIASVLPKGVVCEDTLQTIRPFKIDPSEDILSEFPLHPAYKRAYSDREMFVMVGLLNSIPFDFIMSKKVETHISKYKFAESQVPRLTDGDDWFHYISERAANLNCYGDSFKEMRERLGGIDPVVDYDERQETQSELDAAAFHAYGLNREQTAFVLDDFYRLQNPNFMTEEYFTSVIETYDELAETGPHL